MINRIILASNSPRRRQLLEGIGLSFEVIPPDSELLPVTTMSPAENAMVSALDKAHQVASLESSGIIVAADTIVVKAGRILGKPTDPEDARAMLRFLSGQAHEVITGLAVIDIASGREETAAETTKVIFRHLDEHAIQKYVASGEPLDKAGAYGIQGLGALLVKRIEGCYFNVVGLPLVLLGEQLQKFGINLL
ncbi:MAG: Maf family protein [Solirubrobacterales bacterium]